MLSTSDQLRLQHLADGVLQLDSLADDSPVFALLPDSLRCEDVPRHDS